MVSLGLINIKKFSKKYGKKDYFLQGGSEQL